MRKAHGTFCYFFFRKEGPSGFCRIFNTPFLPVGGGRIQSLRAFRRANVEVVGGPKGGPADELRDSARCILR